MTGVPASALYGPNAAPTPKMERDFFAGLELPNGTFKTTSDHRLDDLNEALLASLPDRRPLRVKDVAVSSGISTLELHDALRARGVQFEMTATDVWLRARMVRAPGFNALLDESGGILQVAVAGLVFQPSRAPKKRMAFAPILACIRRPGVLRRLTLSEQEVLLVSPRVLGSAVQVVEEDLLAKQAGEWDVIRAANIVNRGYFPDDVLRQILSNLAGNLAPDGLLSVCRTEQSSKNRASIFRRTQEGLRIIAELNGGSDVADLVDCVLTQHRDTRSARP